MKSLFSIFLISDFKLASAAVTKAILWLDLIKITKDGCS